VTKYGTVVAYTYGKYRPNQLYSSKIRQESLKRKTKENNMQTNNDS